MAFHLRPWLRALRHRTPLGWLQLKHDRNRLLVALSGIAFADILMFMQIGFQTALYDSNTRLHRAIDADIVLLSPQARFIIELSTFPRRRLLQARDVPGVERADPFYVGIANWKNPETRRLRAILVLGFDPNHPPLTFLQGHPQLHQLQLPDRYLFDRNSRGEYTQAKARLDAGQAVNTELSGQSIAIIGTYQLGTSFAADGSISTSDRNFLRAFPGRTAGSVSLGLIQLQPGADPQQTAATLRQHLPDDVQVLTHAEFVAFEKSYWRKNTAIGFVFSLGTAMGFVVGVIIVYQVLATDVNDHLGEYATLKAMGYRYRYFLAVVFEEAIILAVLGFLPGMGVSLGLYALTRHATKLPLYMTTARAVQVLLLTIIMCSVSGALATRRLQAADPAEMFA
jgi:putative ABC transport system permease protein